jgi:hypothetical protein
VMSELGSAGWADREPFGWLFHVWEAAHRTQEAQGKSLPHCL